MKYFFAPVLSLFDNRNARNYRVRFYFFVKFSSAVSLSNSNLKMRLTSLPEALSLYVRVIQTVGEKFINFNSARSDPAEIIFKGRDIF